MMMGQQLLILGCTFFLLVFRKTKAEVCGANGDLRLAGNETEYEGRVEICLGGEWGTICDDHWGALDAKVACSQLGLPSEYAETILAFGGGSGTIHYSHFRCMGNETRLDQCPVDKNASQFEYPDCFHWQDAGIRCPNTSCTENWVRLDNQFVKVCHNQRWGFVCESVESWNDDAASLVCDQVGHSSTNPRSLRIPLFYFDGPVFLNDVECNGKESFLVNCSEAGYGNFTTSCSHIAIASCEDQESCNVSNSVRLTQYTSDKSGRLEMCANGKWGSVCAHEGMTSAAKTAIAKVVCREINHAAYGLVRTELSLDLFFLYIVPIRRTNLLCIGNESSLSECSFQGADGDSTCTHRRDIIIFCAARQCNETDVRLTNGSTLFDGRVEICLDGLWGTVCDHKWDFRDAQVVCRQLNFDGSSYPLLSHFDSELTDAPPIHLDDVHCNGTEEFLFQCNHRGLGINNCEAGSDDAHVLCTNTTCEDGTVHLVGGDDVSRGRVEYCYQGAWYSVCANGWDARGQEARALCRGLGYPFEAVVVNYGRGGSPILPFNFECTVDDNELGTCRSVPVDPNQCQHVAGVTCLAHCHEFGYSDCKQCGSREKCEVTIPTEFYTDECNCYSDCYKHGDCCSDVSIMKNCIVPECETGDVRLVGGATNSTGRLEVCGNGIWGRVCNAFGYWGPDNARVVCRQLGYSDEGAYIVEDELASVFGTSSKIPIVGEVHCIGTEPGWLECSHTSIGRHSCGPSSPTVPDIIISCLDKNNVCKDGDARLRDGFDESNGRVEYCRHRTWGRICADDWNDIDAKIVCQQLGYNSDDAEAIVGFPSASNPVLLKSVTCSGTEEALRQCNVDTVEEIVPCKTAGVTCSTISNVPRCVDSTTSMAADLRQGLSFGECDVYVQQDDVCSSVLRRGVDYVYVSNRLGNQSSVSRHLNKTISSVEILLANDKDCADMMFRLLCAYYYPLCGDAIHFNPPASICQDECNYVQESCPNAWQVLAVAFGTSNAISCKNPSLLLYPQPHCCTGAGIELPTIIPSPEVEVKNAGDEVKHDTGSDSGGRVAGAVIGVMIILLALVSLAGVAALFVYLRRKKNKQIAMITLDIMATHPGTMGEENTQAQNNDSLYESMIGAKESGFVENPSTTYPNPYSVPMSSKIQDNLLPPHVNRPRVPSHHMRHLARGKFVILYDTIMLLECIGEGEFGIVYKAKLKTGEKSTREVAVKTLKGTFDQDEVDKFLEESMKMSRFKHAHVMGLIGVCLDAGAAPLIIMPFMANGSLLKYLKTERENLVMSEENDEDEILEVRKRLMAMCSQIASGMEYLAAEKYVHRDLAARNCMIDMSFLIKITDFGLSEDVFERNYFRQGSHEEVVRLPIKWMAPESLSDGHFSEKSDVWSYGVTMWEIFSGGKAPYPGINPLSLIKSLEDGERMSTPSNAACNDEIYDMMKKCWEMSPAKRPSFKEIHSSISKYIGHIGGYLDMGINPFTSVARGGNSVSEGEEKFGAGIILQITPASLNTGKQF